jgi:hypothetical protein
VGQIQSKFHYVFLFRFSHHLPHFTHYLNGLIPYSLVVVVKKFVKDWNCCFYYIFVSFIAEFVGKLLSEGFKLIQ